jgi:LysR family hydrogen peroxide-inducible transcriptional activator
MKALEEMFATPFVERSKQRLQLTSFGEIFLGRVREILQSVDEPSDLARASHQPLIGRFRFGIIPTAAPYFLPRFITRMAQEYPGLDLRPREAVTQKLIDGPLYCFPFVAARKRTKLSIRVRADQLDRSLNHHGG